MKFFYECTAQQIFESMSSMANDPELRKRIEDEFNDEDVVCKVLPNGVAVMTPRKLYVNISTRV